MRVLSFLFFKNPLRIFCELEMKIRFYLSYYFFLFIILNVLGLNATLSQQRNVERVCGKPSEAAGFIIRGSDVRRGEFPWMVAMLNKLKSQANFFCTGTLVSTRHVITGKVQMQNQIFSSFGDKI